ncbi:MAG: hypothetical protein AAF149_19105 [Bacteroidota bacterium]
MGANNSTEHVNEVMNNDVSEGINLSSPKDISAKLNINDKTAYIQADAFLGNPYSLLGRVIEVRKTNGKCPENLNDPNASFEFSALPIYDIKIDESSKIKKPIKRNSIVVDKSLSAKVNFLTFLSSQLDAKSFFSLMVFDQATALVDVQDVSWRNGLKLWKQDNLDIFRDPDVCYLYAVIGMVQKNIVRKKFVSFEAGAKGGAYGLNVDGKLATSTEDYSLDIVFGLTPVVIKRPNTDVSMENTLAFNPTPNELSFFSSASGVNIFDAGGMIS